MGEITEKKDRREIYRALITDPQTAGTFKKYSFTEFESKLLSDEKAATTVAQRMVSKGLVPNMDSFFEQYINEPAPKPVAQQAPSRPVQVPPLLQPAKPSQGPSLTQITGQQVVTPMKPQQGPKTQQGPSLTDVTRQQVITPMKPEPQFQPFQFQNEKEIQQAAKSPVFLANKPAMQVMADREQMAEANPLTWRQNEATGKYGVFEKDAPINSKPLAEFDNMNQAAAAIKTRGAASNALIMPTKEAEQEFGEMSPQDQQMAIEGSTGGKEYQAAEAEKKKSLFQKGFESASNFAGGFNRAIAKAPSDIVQTIDIISRKIWEPVLGKTGPSTAGELATKYEKFLNESDFAKEYIGNPEDESLSGSVGSGLGQIATMIGGGGAARRGIGAFKGVLGLGEGAALANKTKVWSEVGKKILSPESLMSFGQVFNSEYQGMKAKGESDEVAFNQGLVNAFATAPLENLPIANLAERFKKLIGAPLAARVVNALIQGGEEGSQEVVQQIFSNLTNNQFAQLESSLKDWSDGLSQSASAGGIVGGLLGAIAGVKAGRVRGKQAPSQLGGIPTQDVVPTAPAFTPEVPVAPVAPVAPVVTPEAPVITPEAPVITPESDTEFVTATPEELEAYRNGTLTDEDRIAGIENDAMAIEQGAQTLEDLPDDPNYREMVRLKLAENQAAATSQQTNQAAPQVTLKMPEITVSGSGNLFIPALRKLGYTDEEISGMTMEQQQEIATNKIEATRAESSSKVDVVKENAKQEKLAEMNAELDADAELAATSEQSNEAPAAAAPVTEATTETVVAESGRPVVEGPQTEVGKIIGKQFRLLNEGKILDMEGNPIYDMTGGITTNGLENLTNKKYGHSSTRLNEEGSLDVLNNILSTGNMEGWFGTIGVEGAGPWTTGKFFIASNSIDGGSKGKIDPSEVEVILNVGLTPFAQELANKYPQTTIKDYNGNVYTPQKQSPAKQVAATEKAEGKAEAPKAGSLRDVELTMRQPEKNEVIFVPIDALLEKQAADQPSYDIQKEDNRIKGRVEKAKEFLKNYLKDQRAINPKTGKRTNAKVSFEPSVVDIDADGKISFEDGRHRVLAAKELGLTEVPIEVPKGKGKAIQESLKQKTTNDNKNKQGVSGEVGVGQESVQAQPVEGGGTTKTQAGGNVQGNEKKVSPLTAFQTKGEAGRKAREALKEEVGPEEFRRMDNIHRNGEKMLRALEGKGILEIRCP